MADNTPTGPIQLGAEMDYSEHEKTYSMFLALSKYVTLFCVVLMIAMAFTFFTSAGFFSGLVMFFVLNAVGAFLLRG
ncbi:aa3-type cytochrome c oxidase subunit IV [Mesorhizobium sp. NBSH29]|uniref:aa3-type cytochrome c oxidase subunit IV n=1 Tax=Mesorhizobium sp. NBSH29 TaxID=2654249 RepID=UPI00189653F1|nr:aa3-type cytochrome c oxidase subunit IV [Mesorhizobium sp. NBSH29]QPC85520.1 aa3-type cytochrome c oxidase subunit IV [Mesorhizobium sp. NBSH29]